MAKKSTPVPETLKRERLASPANVTQGQGDASNIRKTPRVERDHVHKVYDSIAPQWHGTRYKSWPKVQAFIESKGKGTLFADVGCGNGKNIPACNSVGQAIGSDTSVELLKISTSRGHSSVQADIVNLPYRDQAFDSVICIAVLHHLSTEERRVEALRECMRIVRQGGDALFYAWAMEQKMPAENAQKVKVEGNAEGRSGHRFDEPDVLVPWHIRRDGPVTDETAAEAEKERAAFLAEHAKFDEEKNAFIFQRYCHVYAAGELERLAEQLGESVSIEKVYWDTGNWAMVLKKVA